MANFDDKCKTLMANFYMKNKLFMANFHDKGLDFTRKVKHSWTFP